MPRATTNINDTETHQLKSCPPDGFVTLRRMNYGELLARRNMAGKMGFLAGTRNKRREADEIAAVLQMANEEVTKFEFAACVVDHNLTDDNDNPLDFKSSFILKILHPRVGEEISRHISDMNQFEEDLEPEGNSPNGSAPVLS